MRKLVFAKPAERDLNSIIDYIGLGRSIAAEKVYRSIMTTATRLPGRPEMGRPGRIAGTREFSALSLPYVIVYEIDAESVTILAVFHTARDLARELAERQSEPKQWRFDR